MTMHAICVFCCSPSCTCFDTDAEYLEARKEMAAFQKPTFEELSHRYTYHPPKGDQASRYEVIRAVILGAAKIIVEQTPCSPEQTRALNALDEAMFLANAAVARHG